MHGCQFHLAYGSQLQKLTWSLQVSVLPCPFRCWCLFTEYRTPVCVLVVIRTNLEGTHLGEIIVVLVMVCGSIYISLWPLHDWHFQVGDMKDSLEWHIISLFHSSFFETLNLMPREIFSEKSLFKALISVQALKILSESAVIWHCLGHWIFKQIFQRCLKKLEWLRPN